MTTQPEPILAVPAPPWYLRLASSAKHSWPWLALAAIVLGGLALRLAGLRISLPFVDHPDEPNPIDYVVQMLRSGDPNPHAFQKPSLYVYLLLAVLSLHYRLGQAGGLYTTLDTMPVTTHLFTTIPAFFLWGRMLTVMLGLLTLLSVFRLGRRTWGVGAGLAAALLLALSPFHVRHSQFVTTDVASGWLVLLTFGAALAVAREGRLRDYLAAGAFAGLAASTKYNAGVAALMVVAAHLLYARRRALRQLPGLIGAGAAALAGFLAGTPYALLSWREFVGGLLGQLRDYSETAHGDVTGAWNWRGYLGFFADDGLGWLGCVALLAGLALAWRRQRALALIWLSFVLPYLLLHLAQESHFMRNMLPVVVLAALPIGALVAAAAELRLPWRARADSGGPASSAGAEAAGRGAQDKTPPPLRPASRILTHTHAPAHGPAGPTLPAALFPFALLVVILLGPAQATWQHAQRLGAGDTRVQALAWIDAQLAPGARIAAELRALPGPLESPWADARGLLRYDLAWYRAQGYAYVLASSDSWHQWPIPSEYRAFAGAPPLAEFGGATPREMLGPHLALFATGLAPEDAPVRPAKRVLVGGARLAGIALGRPEAEAPWLGLSPTREFAAGETIGLRTFWSVEQPFEQDLYIFIHLLDASGAIATQRATQPWQGRYGTRSWRAGSLVVDVNDLALPAGLAPGRYTLALGMFDLASGARPPTSVGGKEAGVVPVAEVVVR